MQIDSTLPTTTQLAAPATTNSTPVANDSAAQTGTSGTSSQDDAVNISADGAALAAQAAQNAQSAQSAQTGDTAQDGTASDSSGSSDTDADVSPVKSFAYGSLGLERPDQPQSDGNTFYTAGRWLAAGITIGGLVSLLV